MMNYEYEKETLNKSGYKDMINTHKEFCIN